ncbi:peroxiredoxin [Dictyobacter kobayashii]|uniref:thioredoxin-dependent peroxiredoxin n=1 Tax=Dictyobacter kobayashii TaxID=2014872 RepID=A0A402ALL7_9CHLR|nr:peroxiredoxin [Dictyobacter kobayashii]GCE20016.1 peroxiredoxin [Dictyobacter kobayashii]
MSVQSGNQQVKGKVQVGDKAPDFTLPSQDGKSVQLGTYLGKKNVVLYFYPRDNSPACTAEACAFRDSYEVFSDAGAAVIGINSGSVASHQQFASKNRLPFPLLSDENSAVRKLYGVPATLGLIPGRVTYIIDKKGVVRHIFSALLAAEKHIEEALKILEQLKHEEA